MALFMDRLLPFSTVTCRVSLPRAIYRVYRCGFRGRCRSQPVVAPDRARTLLRGFGLAHMVDHRACGFSRLDPRIFNARSTTSFWGLALRNGDSRPNHPISRPGTRASGRDNGENTPRLRGGKLSIDSDPHSFSQTRHPRRRLAGDCNHFDLYLLARGGIFCASGIGNSPFSGNREPGHSQCQETKRTRG